MSNWFEKNIELKDKDSVHLRPAQRFAEVANSFKSDIRVVKGTRVGEAKSMLDMIEFLAYMVLNTAKEDKSFTVRACGPDAEQALEALSALVNDRFGAAEKKKPGTARG